MTNLERLERMLSLEPDGTWTVPGDGVEAAGAIPLLIAVAAWTRERDAYGACVVCGEGEDDHADTCPVLALDVKLAVVVGPLPTVWFDASGNGPFCWVYIDVNGDECNCETETDARAMLAEAPVLAEECDRCNGEGTVEERVGLEDYRTSACDCPAGVEAAAARLADEESRAEDMRREKEQW